MFAILFGTRVIDATEHHPGMVLAIAAESLFKLLALLLVGVFALTTLDGPRPLRRRRCGRCRSDLHQPSMFFAQALTAMFAFFCLPRQFHIGVVECADVADVRRARWWFGGYLVLLSIVVIPDRRGVAAARCRRPRRAERRCAGAVAAVVARA